MHWLIENGLGPQSHFRLGIALEQGKIGKVGKDGSVVSEDERIGKVVVRSTAEAQSQVYTCHDNM